MDKILTTMIICGLLIVFSTTLAQTEISGEVSGEWNADGSPYIVVDSTWIAEGDSLTVLEAVTIIFEEAQGLHVFGTFTCLGGIAHEATNYILVAEGVEHWKGLRFYGQNHVFFESTEIVGPDTTILLDNAYQLTMNECDVEADISAISPIYHEHVGGWTIDLNWTDITCRSNLNLQMCVFTAVNSELHLNSPFPNELSSLISWGGTLDLSNCHVTARLSNTSQFTIEDCVFTGMNPNEARISVSLGGGRIIRTIVDGNISIRGDGDDDVLLEDSDLHDFSVNGSSADIIGCSIYGTVFIDRYAANFLNCDLNSSFGARLSITNIDSCYLFRDNWRGESISMSGGGRLTMSRSVADCDQILIRDNCTAVFDHNTIVIKNEKRQAIKIHSPNVTIKNNILIADGEFVALINAWELPEVFEFNNVWGFEAYANPPFDDIIVEAPETNIDIDPHIDWYVHTPLLAHDSPCIDAGDPDAPADPDGTRSDIGAIAFYQPNSVNDYLDKLHYPDCANISAYPNPFNGIATFAVSLNRPSNVKIAIINTMGRRQMELVSGNYQSGSHEVSWDATNLPTGVYFARMNTGTTS